MKGVGGKRGERGRKGGEEGGEKKRHREVMKK